MYRGKEITYFAKKKQKVVQKVNDLCTEEKPSFVCFRIRVLGQRNHSFRHCRRTNCEETLNDTGLSAANPLLSNFTPGADPNVFQQSNLTQSYKDENEDIQQIEDLLLLLLIQIAGFTMTKN
jgi:hypothetical protein